MSCPERAVTRALAPVCAAALLLTALMAAPAGAQEPAPRFRALVFSKVTNFRHESIPAGIAAIQRLGEEHNFEVVATDDAGAFTDDNLATFDVIVFNNTNSTPASGDLLNAEQRAAFQRFIRAGGGYAGLHAATASERDWEWYEDLVGAIFSHHPDFGATGGTYPGRIKVLDRAHPSTRGLPEIWERSEEWYNWTVNPTGKVHTLAQIKVRDGIPGLDQGVDHPYSWCQTFDGGRSWYTAGGHAASSFDEPLFMEHLRGGIEWAAGAVEGDCGANKDGSFQKVLLDDEVADPFELAVLPDRRVMYIQRTGQIKLIDQETLGVTVAGDLELGLSTARHSDGLIGMALDDDFASNGWFYILYSDPDVKRLNLSRFTLTGDTVDMNSERVLLEIPTWRDEALANVHMAGSLAMSPAGDLYAAIGDNTDPFESSGYAPIDERDGRRAYDAQGTAGNTNDLRGKVLRITPTDDGGYTVPAGNLFSPGTMGTKPEIYAMGWRNPFRITVDPHDGALLVADYGPDARQADPQRGPEGIVEWNRITEAGNYGWPYCIGNNIPFIDYDFATGQSGAPFDCANIVNDSPNNTGLTTLPPAREALVWYSYEQSEEFPELGTGGAGPMSGPVYDYDPDLDSPSKFPEYYDRKWFNFEYTRNYYKVFSLYGSDHTFEDERFDPVSTGELLSINSFMRDTTFVAPFEAEFGPDGSLYVIDFGLGSGTGRGGTNEQGGIYRIDYLAGDQPPVARASAEPASGQAPLEVAFSSAGSFSPTGLALSYAWDFDGDGEIDSTEPNPTHTYTANGEYTARLTVTDTNDRSTIAVENVVVGNTEPHVAFDLPPDGGFFAFGEIVDYGVSVDDPEDGDTAGGDIDCNQVSVSDQLGHDDHAHPLNRYTGCEGSIQTVTGDSHGPGQNLYYKLQASYTDAGGDGVGPLTGVANVTLQTKDKEAEHYDQAGGVQILDRPGASGDRRVGEIEPGDWIAFEPVNLTGIDAVTLGVSSGGQGGTVEFRRDAPDGELLGSVGVENTGDWANIVDKTVELDDPGVTFDLYLVFTNPDYDPAGQDLLSLDTVTFEGAGIARPGEPPPEPPSCPGAHSDEFDGDALDRGRWTKIVREDPAAMWLGGGGLTLPTVDGRIYSTQNNDGTNIVLQTMPDGAWEATTKVTAPIGNQFQKAGIIVYGDDDNYVRLNPVGTAAAGAAPDRKIEFISEAGGVPRNATGDSSASLPADFGDTYYLKVISDGSELTAAYSADGAAWTPVGRPAPLGEIADPHIGLIANKGKTTSPVVDAAFEWFRVEPDGGGGPVSPDDEFDGDELDGCRWTEIVNPVPDHYRVADGHLEIETTSGGNFGANNSPPIENQILQAQPEGDWTIETKVTAPLEQRNQQAGLVVYGDDANYVKFDIVANNAPDAPVDRRFELRSEIGDSPQQPQPNVAVDAGAGQTWWLRLTKVGTTFTGAYSADGEDWTSMPATVDNDALADAMVGPLQQGRAQSSPVTVRFDHFRVLEAVTPECDPATAADGFTPLWNGQDLDGWEYIGDGGFSVTADCTLLSGGQAGLLWYTPQPFADFELALDYRLGNVDDNSGVFVRFPEPEGWEGGWSARPDDTVRGHEIQINDNPGGDPQKTGAVYNLAQPTASASNPIGEWNEMLIRVRGQHYTVTVNGEVVNDVVSDAGRALSGHIGLQAHHVGSDVEFRDVAVRELELDTTAPVVDPVTEPAEPDGDAGWHTGPVMVSLDADDPDDGAGGGSGVAAVEVAVDGGDWADYGGPLTLAEDGEHTVAYRATDSAGNVSEPAELTLRIDQTAPEVGIAGVAEGAVHGDSEELTITADAADATSGVAERTLTVGGRAVASGDTLALYRLPLGETTVEATATDAAGNTATERLLFRVTTSFRDVDRLLDRFAGEDRLSTSSLYRLRAQLDRAWRAAERGGDDSQVVAALEDFRRVADDQAVVRDAEARGVLVRDAEELIRVHGG